MSAKLFKIGTVIGLTVLLSGCFVHARHHGYSHHHSSVHVHGHVHGRPSKVIGAVVAGAIIGGIVTAAHHQAKASEEEKSRNASPIGPYYYKATDGRCFWVVPRTDGAETRELIDPEYCEDK